MREFSDFEKNAIRIIVNNKPDGMAIQNFQTVVANLLSGINVGIDVNLIGEQIIVSYSTDNEDEYTKINKIIDCLISLQILYEYLESRYLIRLYNYGLNGDSLENKGKKYSISKEIPDKRINEYYCTHWTYLFCVSDELKTLFKNNFKTQEQLDFEKQFVESRKQTKYTLGAFIVAILAFVVSLVSAIITHGSNDNELIKNEIRSIKTETPKLINQQIKNDTLKVNMIKK